MERWRLGRKVVQLWNHGDSSRSRWCHVPLPFQLHFCVRNIASKDHLPYLFAEDFFWPPETCSDLVHQAGTAREPTPPGVAFNPDGQMGVGKPLPHPSSGYVLLHFEARSTLFPRVPIRSELQFPVVLNDLKTQLFLVSYSFLPHLPSPSASWDHLVNKQLAFESFN